MQKVFSDTGEQLACQARGHSERKKKKRQTEEGVGRQYQRVDRNGLCQLN